MICNAGMVVSKVIRFLAATYRDENTHLPDPFPGRPTWPIQLQCYSHQNGHKAPTQDHSVSSLPFVQYTWRIQRTSSKLNNIRIAYCGAMAWSDMHVIPPFNMGCTLPMQPSAPLCLRMHVQAQLQYAKNAMLSAQRDTDLGSLALPQNSAASYLHVHISQVMDSIQA